MKRMEYGDCTDEQGFKMRYIGGVLSKVYGGVFCIETEETVHGFPDVMCLHYRPYMNVAGFFEFKRSDSSGVIHFEPTQPAFYRRNPDMDIDIIALDSGTGEVHRFPSSQLFEDGQYRIDAGGTVHLRGGK